MRRALVPGLFLLLGAMLAAQGAASAPSPAPLPAASTDFSFEGGLYRALGRAQASTEVEAIAAAREAAWASLFAGLGKDALFAEVFRNSASTTTSFESVELAYEAGLVKATARLRSDDESVRIVANGPYLQAAVSLLDEAEAAGLAAESLLPAAAEAEGLPASGGDPGLAAGRYAQILDRCDAALSLLAPLADPGIFSTTTGRSVVDLALSLASLRDRARKGLERAEAARASLAAGEAQKTRVGIVEEALLAADRADALLSAERPVFANPEGLSRERLRSLRSRLAIERSSLADASSSLRAILRDESESILRERALQAQTRLLRLDETLEVAWAAVDLEIRDPAAVRAARAETLRWLVGHESREYLQMRAWIPLDLDLEEGELAPSSLFDARIRSEGALGERSGAWARASLERRELYLAEREGRRGRETALSSSFDFGFWGRGLFWGGYAWDWSREVEGLPLAERSLVRLGLGGVGQAGAGFRRADWLLGLSWELPLEPDKVRFWDFVNAGLEAQFRLGRLAQLEAAAEARARRAADGSSLDAVAAFRAAFGLRLPPPFIIGAEVSGSWAAPLKDNGSTGEFAGSSALRFFLEYGI